MFQFALRRITIFPLTLLIANFIGFAFAFSTAPIVTASDPYSFGTNKLPPVMPAYFDYLQDGFKGDFGSTLTLISTIGLALPSFYVAILLIALFILITIYIVSSTTPLIPFQGFGWDAHLILPVLALVIQPTVKIAQVTASLLSEEMEKQYVTAALSFGHPFKKIKGKFAFRSILAPVVLTIAASLRIMIAELIIIERLFNWPGMGKLISSLLSRDSLSADLLSPPMIAAVLTILVGVFLLIDFLATFLSRLIDPRLRADSEMQFKGAAA